MARFVWPVLGLELKGLLQLRRSIQLRFYHFLCPKEKINKSSKMSLLMCNRVQKPWLQGGWSCFKLIIEQIKSLQSRNLFLCRASMFLFLPVLAIPIRMGTPSQGWGEGMCHMYIPNIKCWWRLVLGGMELATTARNKVFRSWSRRESFSKRQAIFLSFFPGLFVFWTGLFFMHKHDGSFAKPVQYHQTISRP